jgi:ceramide glucosyltransferase
MRTLEIVAAVGTLASLAYYFVCLWSAASFQKAKPSSESFRPPVSILKPLKGTDPEMYESFRSHCLQEYVEYEIIFGLNDPVDPAIELVERLKKEFPHRSIRLIFCPEHLGPNTKVSNLAQMLRQSRYEHIIVNDSDIRVPPHYLSSVLAPLTNPQVGLVTCLYRGIANRTLGSQLESLGISTDFASGVLVARQLEGIRFGLGSTLAFRKRDLDSIGGFQSVVDYLADDYQLGNRIAQQGLKVELSETIVETFLPEYSFADFLSHQIRWGRTVRDSRLGGYIGLIFTFGIPWALIAVLFSRGALWAWALLAFTFAVRTWVALKVGKSVLQDPQVSRFLYLLPLRDVLAALIWIVSFTGHTIHWRGDKFYLRKGKLEPITTKTEST